MRHFILIAALLISVSACKKTVTNVDDCYSYDYRDCETAEPYLSLTSFQFTIDDQVKTVPFIIYEGNVESGTPLFYDTAKGEKIVYYNLEFGKYSVKAEYKIGNKTYYVIDGGKLQKWSADVCDSVCWSWDSLHLDLRRVELP
jgi:hypothetical protein